MAEMREIGARKQSSAHCREFRRGGVGFGIAIPVAVLLVCCSPIGISLQGGQSRTDRFLLQKGGNLPLFRATRAATALRLRVSLKGGGDYDDEHTGWGTLDFNAADPNLLGPEDQEIPWPEEVSSFVSPPHALAVSYLVAPAIP
eukprot:176904-Rhodomonas_salina.1